MSCEGHWCLSERRPAQRRPEPAGDVGKGIVMADAADLVDVRHTLRQVVNVKGD